MFRLLAVAIVVFAVLAGGIFLLAGQASERPRVSVEKAVDLANLS